MIGTGNPWLHPPPPNNQNRNRIALLIPRYNPPMTELRIGTSAFTAAGWEGSFYPAGIKPRDFLTYYATKFNTVEIDSTFYRCPSRCIVEGWANKTPEGFLIAANDCETKIKGRVPEVERTRPTCGDLK